MDEVWCMSHVDPDDETPSIQSITVTAYVDAEAASHHLGGNELRMLDEDRYGLKVGRALVLRYCVPDFSIDGIDRQDVEIIDAADHEGKEVFDAMRRSDAITGARKSNGIIITKSMHVVPCMRGNRVSARILQEIRRLHCGMAFHYAHRSIPQECASLRSDFPIAFERLRQTYLTAGVGLVVPDESDHPEVMTAYWDGQNGSYDMCQIDWNKVTQGGIRIAA